MNENLFWHAISLFDWNQVGDDAAVMGRAIDALSRLTLDDLAKFDEILAEKLYALDGLTYASNLAPEDAYDQGNFSADFFLLARCCVVANGRDYYEHVLNNPWDMPKNATYEPLLYLTYYAARQKGHEGYHPITRASVETFRNEVGWQNA